MRLAELVEKIEGGCEGDGDLLITGLAALHEAQPGELSFFTNFKYADLLANTQASAVIVAQDWQGVCPCAVIRVPAPDKAMAMAAYLFEPQYSPRVDTGMDPMSSVAADAKLGEGVNIGPFCVVRPGAVIAAGTTLVSGCSWAVML